MAPRYLLYGSERYALGILRPLQEAMRRRGMESAWFFDGPGAGDLGPGEKLLTSVRQVREWAPRAVFAPGNHIPPFFPGVKVEIFHGFDAGKPRHIYIRGYFDMYCTTSPHETSQFQALADRLGHFCVAETGWPKLDPFVDFRSETSADRPVLLYHSTFSPSWSAAPVLHETIARLSRSDEWKWIVALHPKTRAETVEAYRALESDNLSFSDEDNILNLFPKVDMMISDTSSALSEFLLWEKPVVTFRNRRPGPQLIDIADPDQLEPAIRRALDRPPELMQAIREFAGFIHPYRDGKSSERVLDAVEQFIAAGGRNPRRKPLNLWRRLKLRARLGYFGP